MHGMIEPRESESSVTRPKPTNSLGMLAVLLGLGGAFVLLLYLVPRPIAMMLLDEAGAMESMSLWVYVLDIVLLVLQVRRNPTLVLWSIAALIFLVALEVNPHSVFSNWLEKPAVIPGDPVGVRPLGLLILGGTALVLAIGLVRSTRGSFRRMLGGLADVRMATAGAVILPIAFLIDRIQLSRFNWHSGHRMEKGIFYASDVIEETLEFLMPFFFLCAILLWSRLPRSPEQKGSA